MPDNAAIYIADPSLLGSKVFAQLPDVLSYESLSEGSAASGIRFSLAAGEITMNFMPSEQVESHLHGFCSYVESIISDKERLIYVLSRIRHVRLVLGCVITPGFDEADTVLNFLCHFTALCNGLMFCDNTVADYDGEILAGPDVDQDAENSDRTAS